VLKIAAAAVPKKQAKRLEITHQRGGQTGLRDRAGLKCAIFAALPVWHATC